MILMFNYITKSIIPIIVLIIITYGMIKGRKVYDWFVEGAKDGLKVCVNIFPYLLAMIIAVQIFREANLLDMLNNAIAPLCKLIDLPKEVDTPIGLVASVIMGTTETIFYTVTVYFGAVKIKKTRHTVWAAIMADMSAIIMAILMVKVLIL